jgi:hypothetical protein
VAGGVMSRQRATSHSRHRLGRKGYGSERGAHRVADPRRTPPFWVKRVLPDVARTPGPARGGTPERGPRRHTHEAGAESRRLATQGRRRPHHAHAHQGATPRRGSRDGRGASRGRRRRSIR